MSLSEAQRLVCDLADEAQALPDPRMFPARVLDRLEGVLGFDTAICVGLDGPRRQLAQKRKESYLRFLKRYADEPLRYEAELARGRMAARLGGGAYLDTEIFSSAERRELPFFAEIIRPQGISSQIVALVQFRGRPLAALHFCRHGSGPRFSPAELATMQAISPLLGLAHAAFRNLAPAADLGALGPREREVARLASQGLHNREIAALMGSSSNTVRNQLHRVFEKLGVSTRAELAAWVSRA